MLVEMTRAVDQILKHAASVMIDKEGRTRGAKADRCCVLPISPTLDGGPGQTDAGEKSERFRFVTERSIAPHVPVVDHVSHDAAAVAGAAIIVEQYGTGCWAAPKLEGCDMAAPPTGWLKAIGKSLRHEIGEITRQPLPRRWIDLIHHLHERDRRLRRQPGGAAPSSNPGPNDGLTTAVSEARQKSKEYLLGVEPVALARRFVR
jgi:hypothetical protein